jgi:hypothetical protein
MKYTSYKFVFFLFLILLSGCKFQNWKIYSLVETEKRPPADIKYNPDFLKKWEKYSFSNFVTTPCLIPKGYATFYHLPQSEKGPYAIYIRVKAPIMPDEHIFVSNVVFKVLSSSNSTLRTCSTFTNSPHELTFEHSKKEIYAYVKIEKNDFIAFPEKGETVIVSYWLLLKSKTKAFQKHFEFKYKIKKQTGFFVPLWCPA